MANSEIARSVSINDFMGLYAGNTLEKKFDEKVSRKQRKVWAFSAFLELVVLDNVYFVPDWHFSLAENRTITFLKSNIRAVWSAKFGIFHPEFTRKVWSLINRFKRLNRSESFWLRNRQQFRSRQNWRTRLWESRFVQTDLSCPGSSFWRRRRG